MGVNSAHHIQEHAGGFLRDWRIVMIIPVLFSPEEKERRTLS
jgi:hypothetical protein